MRDIMYRKDVKELLPKMLEKMTDMGTSKWTSQVSERLAAMATMSPEEAKARFLGKSLIFRMLISVSRLTERKSIGKQDALYMDF